MRHARGHEQRDAVAAGAALARELADELARVGLRAPGAAREEREQAERDVHEPSAGLPPRAVGGVLAREGGDEARVVARVAAPQPPRLARQPVGPLETVA